MSTCVEKVMNGDYNPFNPKIKFLNFNLLYSLWIMYGSYDFFCIVMIFFELCMVVMI